MATMPHWSSRIALLVVFVCVCFASVIAMASARNEENVKTNGREVRSYCIETDSDGKDVTLVPDTASAFIITDIVIASTNGENFNFAIKQGDKTLIVARNGIESLQLNSGVRIDGHDPVSIASGAVEKSVITICGYTIR